MDVHLFLALTALRTAEGRRLFHAAGARVLFLPPYLPDELWNCFRSASFTGGAELSSLDLSGADPRLPAGTWTPSSPPAEAQIEQQVAADVRESASGTSAVHRGWDSSPTRAMRAA